MHTHCYHVYGLTVSSSLACPNLLPGTRGEADVVWRLAPVPEKLDSPEIANEYCQVSPGRFLLTIEGRGRYLVVDGREILIEPEGEINDDIIAFLLGTAMGALLHQRGVVPLHGSSIEVNGRGVVFVGPSGIGKTTLAAALRARGYRILSDDVCVVMPAADGHPLLIPGNPFMRLCDDAANHIGEDTTGLHRNPWGKHVLPLDERFADAPVPMARLYLLQGSTDNGLSVVPVEGFAKVSTLLEHTYRSSLVVALGKTAGHFEQCVAIAGRIQVGMASRTDDLAQLDAFVNLLEQDFLPPLTPGGIPHA